MTKGKIKTAFARLNRLGLGKGDEDAMDAQESMRRVDLIMSVTSVLELIAY